MNGSLSLVGTVTAVTMAFVLSSCSTQEQTAAKTASTPAAPAPAAKAETKAAPTEAKAEKAPEKAKAEKARGDVGLLDTEKNYMILVTKEGKLLTLDFDPKTKATQIDPTPAKMTDIGLGSSATVVYEKAGDKGIASSVEFKPAKGE